ncbi:hypothetical protein Tco_0653231 [Tanacetum coccineum]|uniref:Uncharacterized protein n=1 Tax=Tanacetum coccineum TaxID=301880 RepID=A0ABQ4WZZ0_9ASTR
MAPPVRTDEQILPRNRWVPIGKSNCYLNEEKSQPNPIFKIAVDILKQTNFFRAFTTTAPRCSSFTQSDNNKAFSSPPTPDTLVEFVNKLGYPKEVIHLSNVTTNDMFQQWRALTTVINLCLTGKTSGFERPRAQCYKSFGVLSIKLTSTMLKGCGKNLLNLTLLQKGQKGSWHNTSGEVESHLLSFIPSHLKFSAKGSKREVFGMTIPNELINNVIRGADYLRPFGKSCKESRGSCCLNPALSSEEAILQKVLEESLTDAYPNQRGPLPPVVFRETDTRKFQPLPEVPGKGKEKVGEEQVAQVLINLQTPKKKSSAKQYIFQRRSQVPTKIAGREDSTSLYAELGLYGSDTESDEEMPSVVRSGAQDEGQAGSDPGTRDEGQAGPNPDDVAESLPLPTPCVLAGPNLEHSDFEITDPSSQPQPEHMDEGFTAAAYPDLQENLKLTVDEQVILEEPVSSTGTLSSLQHLAKDFSFGDQFLNDKPSKADNEKTTTDTEAESMVLVTI